MSDTYSPVATSKNFKVAKFVVLTGLALALITILGLIGAGAYLLMTYPDRELPKPLEVWIGTTLGFIFGTVSSIVKDFIGVQDK